MTRLLLATLAVLLAFATPLASARLLDLPSGTVTLEATGPGGANYAWDDPGSCSPSSPQTFGLGTTTVDCGADGSFDVHVVDTTPPVVTPPSDVTVTTGNPSGTTVTYGGASATDAVAGSPSVNCSPGSGTNFSVGTTVVTCSASDGTNTGTATFNVTVTLVDSTPPDITVPSSFTAEATGPGGAVATYSATANDNVDGSVPVGCSPDSGSTFALGPTTVTCNAHDAHGNNATPQTFTITVFDTTAPAITTPADVTAEATGASGASVSYPAATASDLVDGSVPVTCSPASGTTFALGNTTVTCNATDAHNNHAPAQTFKVTVQDTHAPTITSIPTGTVVREATGSSGASYSFSVSATDTVDSTPTVTCNHGPGTETYPIGTTHVSCTAKDDSNNTSAASTFDVSVQDTTAPSLTVPGAITKEATGPTGASATFTATASDLLDPSPVVNCDHASGSTFPVGATTVTCAATDASHNTSASKSFTVTVRDTTAPVLAKPGDVTAEATGASGAPVSYPTPTASDLVDGSINANCTPASGSTFALGASTVTCRATDAHSNQATQTFTVTVRDTTAPSFTGVQSQITVEANGATGSKVNYPVIGAVDLVDGPIPAVTCTPASGSLFPLGATPVSCHATDSHSNTGTALFQVSVLDRTPPTLAVPGPTNVYATTPTGIPETAPGFFAFRRAASAADIVDPHPQIADNLGSFAEIGVHNVGFVARDASGNLTEKTTTFTVLPPAAPGAPVIPPAAPAKLPADVTGLKVTATAGGFVRLDWSAVQGAALYAVYRQENSSGARRLAANHGQLVYKGTARTYTDRGVKVGVQYRYVVVAQDAAGNESPGVGETVVPKVNLLRTPKDGAKLKSPPKLAWTRNAEASYYNVQLYRGKVKILSSWPVLTTLQLKRTWKYLGKRYTLTKGVYNWYVWPGFGARAKVDYGDLLGSKSFQMTR
jgi:hypothetical protein